MQRRASAFIGYTIEAAEGNVGCVRDILFEDNEWKIRWFVINTGSWLSSRKILIHPAALGRPDIRQRAFPVTLTKAQVEASPEIASDQPVSWQMDQNLSDYYGYGPTWSGGFDGGMGFGMPVGIMSDGDDGQTHAITQPGDPHLRSLAEVTGYHMHALDGDIGHLEDLLVDDETWKIDYAVIDTKNWGFGNHVLVSPAEIKAVNWAQRYIQVDLTRYKIKCSPPWKEPDFSDRPGR